MRYTWIALLIVLALLGYTTLWFNTSDRLETGIEQWAKDQRAKNDIVAYDALKITGFPYRMRAEITNPAFARATDRGLEMWASETLVIDSYPHKLNHLIFDFPAPIDIDRPVTVNGTPMREQTRLSFDAVHASLVLTLDGARLSITGEGASARARVIPEGTDQGAYRPVGTADSIALHIRPVSDREDTYETYLDTQTLKIDAPDPRTGEPSAPFTRIETRFFVTKAQSLIKTVTRGGNEIDALKAWSEQGGALEIEKAHISTLDLDVTAKGKLTLDENGAPQGPLKFEARGWRKSPLLVNPDGKRSRSEQEAAKGIYELIDRLDGKADGTMHTELALIEGGAWLGPFELMKIGSVW